MALLLLPPVLPLDVRVVAFPPGTAGLEKTRILCPSSRRQTILGAGLPVAVQVSVTLSPSLTVTSDVLRSSTMSGGTWTWTHPSCFFIVAVLI